MMPFCELEKGVRLGKRRSTRAMLWLWGSFEPSAAPAACGAFADKQVRLPAIVSLGASILRLMLLNNNVLLILGKTFLRDPKMKFHKYYNSNSEKRLKF